MMKTPILNRVFQAIAVALIATALCFYVYYANAKKVYTATESFFIENERGSYTFVEVNLPDGEGPFPLVFMAHGFAGTIHSGGAMELANHLSDAGIIAVRCDWNPFVSPDRKSARLGNYALRDMESDFDAVMKYAVSHYDVDLDRLGMYGRSYGGRFAMLAANKGMSGYDFKALGLVAPAGDDICFKRFLGGEARYNSLKNEAAKSGYGEHLKVKLYSEWFEDVEKYVPSEDGASFGNRPVLLFYNTLDDIVYPDTSLRCANAYSNCDAVEITSTDGHGHEMGFAHSRIKDMIMRKIVRFFKENL